MRPRDASCLALSGSPLRDQRSTSELVLASVATAAFRARHHTRAALRGWHLDTELAWTVELLVLELATNAVRCCRRRPSRSPYSKPQELAGILLKLRHLPRHLMVEVTHPDPCPPVLSE